MSISNEGLSLKEKINILELDEERVNELKNIMVKEFLLDFDIVSTDLEVIETDRIVGLNRPIWKEISWIDILNPTYCHKDCNFIDYKKERFDDILLSEQTDGYPSVIEYENEYYINGNGLHRLGIAKCIGNKKARVKVKKITKI